MAARKKSSKQNNNNPKVPPPSKTPEGEEQRLIALSYALAEKQIIAGTASSQVVTHFLKMGATRERLELEALIEEIKLKKAKVESLESIQRMEALYADALKAMRRYSGEENSHNYEDEDDY